MYTLLHGFYKYLTQKDEYCVVILGLDNAGKTVSSVGFARKSDLGLRRHVCRKINKNFS